MHTMSVPKIIISPFCQERDQSYCEIPLGDLLPEIEANFHRSRPGYREGVILVPLHPKNFKGVIRTLQPGDFLIGKYESRTPGETPRKTIKSPCLRPDPITAVDAVLYSRTTLQEGNECSDLSADYEVITLLAKIDQAEQPMPPETLMANHFLDDGGTATNMSPEEFETALKKSYEFWRGRALVK